MRGSNYNFLWYEWTSTDVFDLRYLGGNINIAITTSLSSFEVTWVLSIRTLHILCMYIYSPQYGIKLRAMEIDHGNSFHRKQLKGWFLEQLYHIYHHYSPKGCNASGVRKKCVNCESKNTSFVNRLLYCSFLSVDWYISFKISIPFSSCCDWWPTITIKKIFFRCAFTAFIDRFWFIIWIFMIQIPTAIWNAIKRVFTGLSSHRNKHRVWSLPACRCWLRSTCGCGCYPSSIIQIFLINSLNSINITWKEICKLEWIGNKN